MNRYWSAALLLVALGAMWFLPIITTHSIASLGKVLPVKEWRLSQDRTGRITSLVHDYLTGLTTQMAAFQFKTGDVSRAETQVSARDSTGFIKANESIFKMYSSAALDEIQELTGQIQTLQAQLVAEKTGEKTPIVQEAENKLYFAQQDFTLRQKQFEIQRKLFADGVIALTEYQTSENDFELARINIEIAQKTLDQALTGLKPESQNITKSQIVALQKRLEILKERNLAYDLHAPFSGFLAQSLLPEDILLLQSHGDYLVEIPIPTDQLQYLSDSTVLEITDAITHFKHIGNLVEVQPQVAVMDNRQVAKIRAVVHLEGSARLSTGISANCTIVFGRMRWRDYLKRIIFAGK